MSVTHDPLNSIRGQESSVKVLRKFCEGGSLPHAFLFFGPPGVGKSYTAVQFAKSLNLRGIEDEDAQTGALIDRGEHPDVRKFGKGEEASFKIDVIREVIHEAHLPVTLGKVKVMILEDIQDFPSYRQSDALLKTIEDGLSDTVFILTAQGLDEVFPTLRSRTFPVQFFPLDTSLVRELIEKESGIHDEESLSLASSLSGGSLDRARRFLYPVSDKNLPGLELRSRAIKILKSIKKAPLHSILLFVDKIPDDDVNLFFSLIIEIYRDLTLLYEGQILNGFTDPEILSSILTEWGRDPSVVFPEIRRFFDSKDRSGLNHKYHMKTMFLNIKRTLTYEK
jgi:DNA polymerase III delta prime subunit